MVEPLAPLRFAPLPDASAITLPVGCAIQGPVLSAPLPAGSVRFVAPQGTGGPPSLVVAVDENGDGTVERSSAFVDPPGASFSPFPWRALESPPAVAASPGGLLALEVNARGGSGREVTLIRQSGGREPLARGDRLEVADFSCEGRRCAALLTLAAASAGPGATLFVGEASAPLSTWARRDLPGGDEGATPLSIVRVRDGEVWIAMVTEKAVSLMRVDAKQATTPYTRIDAPFGTYDAVLGDKPIAILPGSSIEQECRRDGFPIRTVRASGRKHEIEGHVPPEKVVTRTLGSGFLVAWIGPASCRSRGRSIVRAFLFDRDGAPTGTTMAVADARGFALSARGDTVDLWLARADDLVRVHGTCSAAPRLQIPGRSTTVRGP